MTQSLLIVEQPAWKIILLEHRALTEGICAMSINHRMKKKIWVNATLGFQFHGHLQGKNGRK